MKKYQRMFVGMEYGEIDKKSCSGTDRIDDITDIGTQFVPSSLTKSQFPFKAICK